MWMITVAVRSASYRIADRVLKGSVLLRHVCVELWHRSAQVGGFGWILVQIEEQQSGEMPHLLVALPCLNEVQRDLGGK